jgi:hypothetical protein
VSDALKLLNLLRLENGDRWGDVAVPQQIADAEAVLDPHSQQRFHFITRARGFSKTTDLGGIALAVLLTQAPRLSKSYALAADEGQARLLLDSIEGFVHRAPMLEEMVDVAAWKVTQRRSGATLETLAADAPSSWGLRPYFAVVDELTMWGATGAPKRIWEAITTAIPKTGGRLAGIMTAGSPSHWAAKIRDHAAKSPMWRLSETSGPPPWMPTDYLDEQRERLLPSSFARLFENTWTSAEDSLVSEEDLQACVTLTGPLPPQATHGYVIAVDVGLKRDRTVAVVCHGEEITKVLDSLGSEATTATRIVLDRIQVWQGSRERPVRLADVEEWVVTAAQQYSANAIFDPWQSIGTLQRLQARGVRCAEFTFSAQSVGRIASVLHRLLRDRLLALPDDEPLLDELRNVRLRESAPGVVRLDHDSDGHDDRAVALAMAASHLVERSPGPAPSAAFTRFDPWDTEPGSLTEMLHDPGGFSGKLTHGMRL